jgi:PhzF family phenazine biosynthesis protein
VKELKIHQVDVFTDTLFGGNPTAVVCDADVLDDNEMRGIAREMNLSESVFLLPSDKADVKLRFFTPPGDEIKFCGHATVGALHTIATENLYGISTSGGRQQLTVETNAGVLTTDLVCEGGQDPGIILDCPRIDLVPASYELADVVSAMGLEDDQVDWDKPLMLERTNNYLYFASPSLAALEKIELDVRGAIEFAQDDHIVVFCVMTAEALDAANHVHARGYAPLVGVPEDPFTGSMQGGLAAYLVANDMVSADLSLIGSEQGHFIGRPGQVRIEVVERAPEFRARMHASAVAVFETVLSL